MDVSGSPWRAFLPLRRLAAASSACLFLTLAASASGAVWERGFPDKESGDLALADREYGTAASFYRKYRQEAGRMGNVEAVRDAYACELDALISGGMADQAEALLKTYREAFPDLDPVSLSIWQADIFLQQRRLDEADGLLKKLPGDLEPIARRLHVLANRALIAELKQNYREAASLYAEISKLAGKTAFGRRAVERQALALGALGKTDEAFLALKDVPISETKRDVEALTLLNIYLTMRSKGMDSVLGEWASFQANALPRKDNFFYLAASLIAEDCVRRKDWRKAIEAYELAYSYASVREDSFRALNGLIAAFERLDDPETASRLALEMLTLFRGPDITPNFKLRIVSMLCRAGRFQTALRVAQSVLNDASLPFKVREDVYRASLDLLRTSGGASEARALVDSYYRDPARSSERKMDLALILSGENRYREAAGILTTVAGETSGKLRREALMRAMDNFYKGGLYKEALAIGDSLRKEPEVDPNVLFLAASSSELLKRRSEARESYLEYERKAPKTPETAERRANALYSAGLLCVQDDEPEAAKEILLRLLKDYPESSFMEAGSYWLIHVYYTLGDEINAERETWRLIERRPDSEYAYAAMYRLAKHYSDMSGGDNKAASTLLQLVKQDKHPEIRARALYEMAQLCIRRGDHVEAEACLHQLERDYADPVHQAWARYLRGDSLRARNLFTDAQAEYRRAAALRPGTLLAQAALGSAADCLYAEASLQNSPSMFQTAAQGYQSVLDLPDLSREYRAMALYGRAAALLGAGQEDDAFSEFRKLLYLIPPRQAKTRTIEAYWVVRASRELERLARKDPSIDRIDAAISALNWLGQSETGDPRDLRMRIRSLRKIQTKPIAQENVEQ